MLKSIAQSLRDAILSSPRRDGLNLRLRILRRMERMLVRLGNPLVRFELQGDTRRIAMQLPLSHPLPHYMQFLPEYNRNAGRLARHVLGKYPAMTAIDVGANVGDTVAMLRGYGVDAAVLCVEGDPGYFALLKRNVAAWPEVCCVQTYLGATDGVLDGFSAAQEQGTGAIEARSGAQLCIRRLDTVLKDHPRFAAAKFFKIDTDGFDGAVLRGADELLATARPVVFHEYDPRLLAAQGDSGLAIFEWLRRFGYAHAAIYSNLGDWMHAVDLTDATALNALDERCGKPGEPVYVDVAAYHRDDADLFTSTCDAESRRSPAQATSERQ